MRVYPDAWTYVFQKYHASNNFRLCETQARKHTNEFVDFLCIIEDVQTAAAYLNSVYHYSHNQLSRNDQKIYEFIYHFILSNKKHHGLNSSIISAFVKHFNLSLIVKIFAEPDGHVKDALRDRFDKECESVEDFSVWKNPIFKSILSEKQKERILHAAMKNSYDVCSYANALDFDLEIIKPVMTDKLLKENDIYKIQGTFNPKLHDKEKVLQHVAELIKNRQNPDPKDIARSILDHKPHPLMPIHPMFYFMPFGRW